MPLPFTKPVVKEAINRLTFDWQNIQLSIVADRITDEGFAELWFYHSNGDGRKLLHTAKANLLSTTTMNQLVKRMSTHESNVPWQDMMTFVSAATMEYQRKGEPAVVIQPTVGEVQRPKYYIEPLIIKGVPSVIYGDKGVNKTTIGLLALGLIATGADDSDSGLVANGRAKVALLDWESSRDITFYTTSRLVQGGTLTYFDLPYLRCKQTLSDDIDRISNFISEYNIEVVLIDSLGQAAGSDRYDSSGKASALKFFECLRQLNVTSLIIAQNAKGDESNKKTIYGSTYFTYYARNIFELKRARATANEAQMSVALFHQESNYSKKYNPLGFCIDYSDSAIKITQEEVNLSRFIEKVNQSKMLLDLLSVGAQHVKSISKALGTSANSVGVILNRLEKQGLVQKLGQGMWGLATEDEELS